MYWYRYSAKDWCAGKIRAIGVSNYTIDHLKQLLKHCEVVPAVNQVECHPQLQQRELIEFCKVHGITLQAYASLGQGRVRSPRSHSNCTLSNITQLPPAPR